MLSADAQPLAWETSLAAAALGRREQNKLDKRGRIVAAARELFMRKGFEATTSQEIADAAGVVQLRLAEAGHAGHNTIGERFAYGHVKMARLETVPATTLDIALADLTRCDVMKMDIEGAELRALAGGAATIARLRPALVLEVFDAALAGSGHTLADFFGWLDAHGYDVHDIDPDTAGLMPRAAVAPGVSKNIVALPRT